MTLVKGKHSKQEPQSVEHLLAQVISNQIEPNQIQDMQWPGLIDTALDHNLGLMLFHRVRDYTGKRAEFEHLRQNAREIIMKFMAQNADLWEVNDVLRSSGIQTVWVKGSVLAHTVYEQPELRPMGDLDVLVPSARLDHAKAVLQEIGYQPSTDVVLEFPPEFAI